MSVFIESKSDGQDAHPNVSLKIPQCFHVSASICSLGYFERSYGICLDSCQRGGGKVIMVERKGRDQRTCMNDPLT